MVSQRQLRVGVSIRPGKEPNDREYCASSETEYSAFGGRPGVGVCQSLNSPFNLQTPKRQSQLLKGFTFIQIWWERIKTQSFGVSERHWTIDRVCFEWIFLPTFSLPIFGLAKFDGSRCVFTRRNDFLGNSTAVQSHRAYRLMMTTIWLMEHERGRVDG